MRIGVFQPAAGDFSADQRLDALARALERDPVDLVVCPELFASGYHVDGELRKRAEAADGRFAGTVAKLARARDTAIIYGYPERDGEGLYNAAACIDRIGRRLARRRKLVLPPGFEGEVFTPGEGGACVFELEGVRCAILICYEAEFPEAVRSVVLAGAELVAVPTALAAQWHSVAHQLIPTRAFENGVWLLYANYAGEENGFRYLGASCVVAPDGSVVTRAGAEEALIAAPFERKQVEAARSRLPYLRDVAELSWKLGE
jgi:predicted amidohydrolase